MFGPHAQNIQDMNPSLGVTCLLKEQLQHANLKKPENIHNYCYIIINCDSLSNDENKVISWCFYSELRYFGFKIFIYLDRLFILVGLEIDGLNRFFRS